MNKKIEEIMYRVDGVFLSNDVGEYADFLSDIDPQRLEKFAELIIKECVKVADEHDCNLSGNGGEILKHFGIER